MFRIVCDLLLLVVSRKLGYYSTVCVWLKDCERTLSKLAFFRPHDNREAEMGKKTLLAPAQHFISIAVLFEKSLIVASNASDR